jgi:hypothetical protein
MVIQDKLTLTRGARKGRRKEMNKSVLIPTDLRFTERFGTLEYTKPLRKEEERSKRKNNDLS